MGKMAEINSLLLSQEVEYKPLEENFMELPATTISDLRLTICPMRVSSNAYLPSEENGGT
jgi:hypothetical protein